MLAASGAALILCAAGADAKVSFSWSVPELLGTETAGVARSVAEAAEPRPTTILLDSCATGAAWWLDKEKAVEPVSAGRCELTLDLGDHRRHTLRMMTRTGAFSDTVQARDLLIVSIGDSVASGEGNPDVASLSDPQWLERRCHRSMRSGAAQATDAIAASDPHSAVVFLPLACSGASVAAGLLRPFAGVEKDPQLGKLPPQLAEVERLAKLRKRARLGAIDAVLLSIGANDVYFGPLVRFCVFVSNCPRRRFDPDRRLPLEAGPGFPTAESTVETAKRNLPLGYRKVAQRLTRLGIPSGHVVIVEYFDPTRDEHGKVCEELLPGISANEGEWAEHRVLEPLNAAVRAAADQYGWKLVGGVAGAFHEHGICAGDTQTWVRGLAASLSRGAGLRGPLHPNSVGHLVTAALIAPVLAKVVGVNAEAAVAQVRGAHDNESTGVAWRWLIVAAVGGLLVGALLALFAREILLRSA
jgi:lysophospholipase L1-like esterase